MTWRVVLPIKMDKELEAFITVLWNNKVNIQLPEKVMHKLPSSLLGAKDVQNLIDLLNSSRRAEYDTFIDQYIIFPYRKLVANKITAGKYVESVSTILNHGIVVKLLAQHGFRLRTIESFHEALQEAAELVLSKPTLEEAIRAGYDVVANINIMLTGWSGREAAAPPKAPTEPQTTLKGNWQVLISSDENSLSKVALRREIEVLLTKVQEAGKRWVLIAEPLEPAEE